MSIYCNRSIVRAGFATVTGLAVILLAACGGEPEPRGELAEGQEPYLRYCASCHGNAGEGKPPSFPPLAETEWIELPDRALALIVLHGLRGEIEVAGRTYSGYMPPMQHIDDEDIAAIIGFMTSQWASESSALSAADVAGLRGALDQRSPLRGREGLEAALEKLP